MRLLAGLLVLTALCLPARAQSLRDQLLSIAESEHLGHSLQTIAVFGGLPGISAANYRSDAMELESYKLPVSHRFTPWQHGLLAGIAPYGELTLAHARAEQQTEIDNPANLLSRLKLKYRSWSALAGLGLDIPLGDGGSTLRPLLLGGYSVVDSDARYYSPHTAFFEAAGKGIINDAHIDNGMAGAALALVHQGALEGDIQLAGRLRYSQLFNVSNQASNRVLHSEGGFGVATAGAELDGPLSRHALGLEWRWLAFGSATWMTGSRNNMLGFNSFIEMGGGLELVTHSFGGRIEGISLRLSGLRGEGVRGWSAGLGLEF